MSDNEFDQESENEEGGIDEDPYSGLKNIGIILIDIGPSMFDDTRPIKKCLAAVYQQMDKMLLRGYRRNISVCLLRDDDIILTALNDNIIDSSKKILELLQQSTNDLKQQLERTSTPSLRYTFSECLKQMKNLDKINPHIILMTNDDDPHKGDVQENLSAIDVALCFKETNVKLVVLPLKEGFEYDKFYGGLLKAANDVSQDVFDTEDNVYDTVEKINEILECVIKNKVTIRRQYFRLFSKEGQELAIWTQIRHLSKTAHLYANCNISRETQNQVKLEYEEQNAIDLDKWLVRIPTEMDLIIEKQDFKQMCEQMPIGLQLLYITKDKRTSIHYLHKRCLILQNDETNNDPGNSKKQKLFDDLWHYCREKKKYLICAYLGAGNRRVPRLVEFAPDVFQHKPCFVGQIFVDVEQIGDYPTDDEESDSEEMSYKNKSKKKIPENDRELGYLCEMIDKLMVKNFSPAQFASYEYETKAALVKSQLLDIDIPEVENCFPTNEAVKEKLGDTYEKLSDIFAIIEEPKQKRSRKK